MRIQFAKEGNPNMCEGGDIEMGTAVPTVTDNDLFPDEDQVMTDSAFSYNPTLSPTPDTRDTKTEMGNMGMMGNGVEEKG